jgi:hypothetical protein
MASHRSSFAASRKAIGRPTTSQAPTQQQQQHHEQKDKSGPAKTTEVTLSSPSSVPALIRVSIIGTAARMPRELKRMNTDVCLCTCFAIEYRHVPINRSVNNR